MIEIYFFMRNVYYRPNQIYKNSKTNAVQECTIHTFSNNRKNTNVSHYFANYTSELLIMLFYLVKYLTNDSRQLPSYQTANKCIDYLPNIPAGILAGR